MECVAWDEIRAAAVQVVTEQGMAEVGEVHTNLVRAPRLKVQTQEGMMCIRPLRSIMGACGFAVGSDAAQDDARQCTRNGCVDRGLRWCEHTLDQCKIFACQRVLLSNLILYLGCFAMRSSPVVLRSRRWHG